MVVQMRCGCGACDEWAMVELQGEVRLQVEDSGTQPHELDLGEFCADQGSGKAAFTIGYVETWRGAGAASVAFAALLARQAARTAYS